MEQVIDYILFYKNFVVVVPKMNFVSIVLIVGVLWIPSLSLIVSVWCCTVRCSQSIRYTLSLRSAILETRRNEEEKMCDCFDNSVVFNSTILCDGM